MAIGIEKSEGKDESIEQKGSMDPAEPPITIPSNSLPGKRVIKRPCLQSLANCPHN